MKRGNFILTALALFPFLTFAQMATRIKEGTKGGFKINSGEARYGIHYKMKGVTLNVLDLKISAKDSDGALAEQIETAFEDHDMKIVGPVLIAG